MKLLLGIALVATLLVFMPSAEALQKTGGCSYVAGGDTVVDGVTRHTPGFYDCGQGGGGSGGGSPGDVDDVGNGSGGGVVSSACSMLLATRPQNCNNKIAMPAGTFYGPTYNPRTAMDLLVDFASTSVTKDAYPTVRARIQGALSDHTASIASGASFLSSTAKLGTAIDAACFSDLPKVMNANNTAFAKRNTFQFCDAVVSRYDYEAHGTLFEKFVDAFASVGDYKDLIPYASGTIDRYLGGGNSLKEKYEAVARNATCAHWWKQMEVNKCGA